MKAKYIRVSTIEQNHERQIDKSFKGKIYIDRCSGSIPFAERDQAKKLLENESITELLVHSIDRLGRNTLDIMKTIQHFTKKGVNVVSKKEGLETLINGKENPIAKLLIGILSTLSEFELNRIKERQMEGIEQAKARGEYSGRVKGSKEPLEVFFNKQSTKEVIKYLNQGESIRRTAKLSSTSIGKVQKVKKYLEQHPHYS